ncbi:hypothetical protein [Companilactobacillus halodurans]|uniref:Uncharacterized protein n=1 Tax=Companilactobacillus halodurans TaxID=2584183 RepID=A0A5P0ZPB9_9LACO|nr:hypothetical protein [Companilactobacillus halodurans]MQS75969.1 hypothetical protein [Companilactobacillus halodurans]MQS96404.1 hypothetical protein [Companilactobacillus halodurans]
MLSTEISLSDLSLSERPIFETIPGFGIGLKLRPVRSSVHKAERTTESCTNLRIKEQVLMGLLFLVFFYLNYYYFLM